jgi:hypothetical protein
MSRATDDAKHMFSLAQRSFAHAAVKASGDSDMFVLANGLGQIADGLRGLAEALGATLHDVHDVKTAIKSPGMAHDMMKRR